MAREMLKSHYAPPAARLAGRPTDPPTVRPAGALSPLSAVCDPPDSEECVCVSLNVEHSAALNLWAVTFAGPWLNLSRTLRHPAPGLFCPRVPNADRAVFTANQSILVNYVAARTNCLIGLHPGCSPDTHTARERRKSTLVAGSFVIL